MATNADIQAVTVALNTSVGTQDITISGFGTCTGVIASSTKAASLGTIAADYTSSIGFADGTRQSGTGGLSPDAIATSDTSRETFDTAILKLQATSGYERVVAFDSFITDGIRIDITTASAETVYATFYLIRNATVYASTVQMTGGSGKSVTGLGFEADTVFVAGCGDASKNSAGQHNLLSLGMSINDGLDSTASSAFYDQNAQVTSATGSYTTLDNTTMQYYAGSTSWQSKVHNYNADGFDFAHTNSTGNDWISYIAIKFDTPKTLNIKMVDTPTATGSFAVTGVGFKPESVFIIPSTSTALNTTRQTGDNGLGLIGINSDSANSTFWSSRSGQAATFAKSIISNNITTLDVGAIEYEGTLTSLDADGFTLNFSTAGATSRKWAVLSIEDTSPNPSHTRKVDVTGTNAPASTLTGYVALITEANLPTEIWTTALNGGGDLQAYTDSAKTTRIPLEVVGFDTIAQTAQLWVRFPTYSTSDRTVWLFYGKAGESQPAPSSTYGSQSVWQDDELVIHQGTADDATGNHTPTLTGSPSLVSMMWGGQGYDLGTTANVNYITIPHSTGLSLEKDYYVDMWRKGTGEGASASLLVEKANSGNSNGFRLLGFPHPELRVRQPNLSSANLNNTNSITTNAAQKLTAIFDGTTRRLYVDNTVTTDTPTGTVTNNTEDMYIGRDNGASNTPFDGVLGTVRIRKQSISTDLRDEEYNNQSSPATFWTTGTPQDTSGGSLTITPTGIASAEAFGTASVERMLQEIDATGIATAEAFGTHEISTGLVVLTPTGIATEEAFGSPEVENMLQLVTPTGIVSAEEFGAAVVKRMLEIITAVGIGSSEAFGTATVTGGDSIVIPVANRQTWQSIADYLKTLGFTGSNNEIITDWLNSEGYTGGFNVAFYDYWEVTEGLEGSFTDKFGVWRQ